MSVSEPIDSLWPSPELPGSILVVDDTTWNWELLESQCVNQPFELTFAASGEEALRRCLERPFEGAVLDMNLPDMTGLEVCERMQRIPGCRYASRIFLTASAKSTEWMLLGLQAGAIDFLTWPYNPMELIAKLRVMVRLSRQQRLVAVMERSQAMLEVAGGAAHELGQPLASALLILEMVERRGLKPGSDELPRLRTTLERAAEVIRRLQDVGSYVTKPYPGGAILDLEGSRKHHS